MATATAPTPAKKPAGKSPRDVAIERLKARGFLTPTGEPVTRRKFIAELVIAWVTFTVAVGAVGGAIFGGFMVPRVDFGKSMKVRLGPPDQFERNSVNEKFKASDKVWIVHTDARGKDEIFCLSTVCTHLGCTPNWLESERKFKCPCHGSGFRITGINFEGPAPRPLERFKIELKDGELVVDKSVKFLYEKGEWDNQGAEYEA